MFAVPGDGACLFRAIALTMGGGLTAEAVRRMWVDAYGHDTVQFMLECDDVMWGKLQLPDAFNRR